MSETFKKNQYLKAAFMRKNVHRRVLYEDGQEMGDLLPRRDRKSHTSFDLLLTLNVLR